MALGAGIAFGSIAPGLEYFQAVADGDGQARLMKLRFDASRSRGSNG